MLEWLSAGFIYSALKDFIGLLRRILNLKKRHLTPAQKLALRQKWKPQFEEELWKNHTEKLSQDVIVRDVGRLDNYPATDNKKKGISPWFRASLLDTYHRGAQIGLNWGSLIRHGDDEWRYCKEGETGIPAVLIGYIPFENIEAVEWRGDQYYYYPHIYCHFDARKNTPYESLMFCTRHVGSHGKPYYSELAKYEDVRRLNKKLRIKTYFG